MARTNGTSPKRKKNNRVRFQKEDDNKNLIHQLPDMYAEERDHYWYSKEELQQVFQTALAETTKALQAAKMSKIKKDSFSVQQQEQEQEEQYTLRGLESLSPTCQARKQQAELERLRVITTYNKQQKQFGHVNHEEIRALYQSLNSEDVKRAYAYGKLDEKHSYYSNQYGKEKKRPPSAKNNSCSSSNSMNAIFRRMFQTYPQKDKNKQNR